MSGDFMSHVQTEKTETNQNRSLWIQHAKQIVNFSPKDGFEKKEFRSQVELMDYTKACVNSGYHIG